MTRSGHRRRVVLAVSLLAVLASVGLFGWRAVSRHAVAVEGIPARPVLSAWPAELEAGIGRGEQMARGYLHPGDGLAVLSRLYHANGFYTEAIQCYQKLQVLEPGEARWPHLLASILGGFGRLDEALPLCQRAAALAPDYIPVRLQLGNTLLKTNQIAAAAAIYAAALAHDPGNPYALLGLARCDIAGDDWNKAREHLEQAIKLQPDFVGALSLMVAVHEHFGDKAGADSLRVATGIRQYVDMPDPWLDSLTDDCYDPYRLSVAAAVANLSGNTVAARRWLERAQVLAPATGSYPRELGKMFSKAHDYPLARQYLEKAVGLNPGDSDAWVPLVETLTALGETTAAERALAAGLAACPKSPALHYIHGHRLGGAGKYDEAVAELKTAQSLGPSEPNAYIDLALIYFRFDRMEDAVAELKGALAIQPGNPLALEVLARYTINTGDEPAARHWIQQLRQQPRVPAEDLRVIVDEFLRRFSRTP